MEWLCRKVDNEIEVSQHHGAYKLLEEPFCKVCSNPNVTTEECVWHQELYGFNRIYTMGKYFQASRAEADLLSSHILMLKTNKEYAVPLGRALALVVQLRYTELLKSNMLVPVPLHLEEFIQRGYNQALELAKIIGEHLKIPVLHALEKAKSVNMRPLNRSERQKAVRGLYSVIEYRRSDIRGKNILLVDDVITTGFTVSECSDVLTRSGATKANVLALARTVM